MKKRKSKKINPIVQKMFLGIGILSIFIILIFFYFLGKLSVIPTKYFIMIAIIFLLIDLISIMMIRWFKKPLKITAFVLICFLTLISSVGCYFTYRTDLFLNQSFHMGKFQFTTTYLVVSLKDNHQDNINDVHKISYYKDMAYAEDATNNLKENIKKDFEFSTYEDVSQMFQDLNSKVTNAIIVEQTSYDLVFQINKDLKKENFQVLYDFEISKEVNNDNDGDSERFNIYIGGNDFTNSLMDFNMIVTINIKDHKILMTSIPRDYYIPVYGFDGKRDTLSYMGARGIETNYRSLEDFFGINLDYFVKINTESLVGIINEVGGINYCSETAYTTTHATILNDYDDSKGEKLQVKKGCQKLNGVEALTVARERKAFPDGDRQRQKNCQKIILAILEQLKSAKTITNYNNILNNLTDLYQTSIPREVISKLMQETLNNMNWEFQDQSVDGTNAQDYVHLSSLKDYVMYPKMDTVEKAKENIINTLK